LEGENGAGPSGSLSGKKKKGEREGDRRQRKKKKKGGYAHLPRHSQKEEKKLALTNGGANARPSSRGKGVPFGDQGKSRKGKRCIAEP